MWRSRDASGDGQPIICSDMAMCARYKVDVDMDANEDGPMAPSKVSVFHLSQP
jgi:hypothetical protein